MRFWIRELAGWLLMGLGLFVFFQCYRLLLQHYIVEGGSLTVIGVFIFRGGLHLLKVAVAAQVCLEARTLAEQGSPPARASRGAARPPSAAAPGSLVRAL